jgi:two-component sensor histidine kinase
VFRQTARTFEPTNVTPTQARRFVDERLSVWGVTGVSEPVLLAVSEVTTNAITHGDGPVTLTLSASEDRVRVEVEDEGGGRPVRQTPDPDQRGIGGWGLHLVDTVADDWGVDASRRTTVVWFEHRRGAEQDQRAPSRSLGRDQPDT